MTNGIKHESYNPPMLALAALVELHTSHVIRQVIEIDWKPKQEYTVFTDHEGLTYCGAEGLHPHTRYVATDENKEVYQYIDRPEMAVDAFMGGGHPAPDTHRHPLDWKDSLMRVWR